jgi:hypothetical protein
LKQTSYCSFNVNEGRSPGALFEFHPKKYLGPPTYQNFPSSDIVPKSPDVYFDFGAKRMSAPMVSLGYKPVSMYIVFPDVAPASRYSTTASYGFSANDANGIVALAAIVSAAAIAARIVVVFMFVAFPSPVEDWVCEKRGPRGAVCVSRLMSLKGLLWLISTGKMPAVPAPSGHGGGVSDAERETATAARANRAPRAVLRRTSTRPQAESLAFIGMVDWQATF